MHRPAIYPPPPPALPAALVAYFSALAEHMATGPYDRASDAVVAVDHALDADWSVKLDASMALTRAGFSWDGCCNAEQTEIVAVLAESLRPTVVPAAPAARDTDVVPALFDESEAA